MRAVGETPSESRLLGSWSEPVAIDYIGLPNPLTEELLTVTCSPVYNVGNEIYDVNISWTINLPTIFTADLHNSRLQRNYRQDEFIISYPTLVTYPASDPDCDSIPVCDQLSDPHMLMMLFICFHRKTV